jgi:hypothetical protein
MATMTAMGRDDAAYFTPAYAGPETALTAAGAGDNTEITTAQLDLRDQFGTKRFGTLTLVLAAVATLTADKALALKAVRFEHSDDATSWSDVKPGTTLLTVKSTEAGTRTGAAVIDCNLLEAKRYVRAKFTPDLSHTGTDTAKVSAVYLLSSATEI